MKRLRVLMLAHPDLVPPDSLKGASANLRATATAQAAARLEAAARAGDAPQIDTAATALKTEVNRTIDYLRTKVAASA